MGDRQIPLPGKNPLILENHASSLLGVYGSDNGLKDWTTRWEEYLETVRRDRNDVRLVYVAPEPLQEGPPRFSTLAQHLTRSVGWHEHSVVHSPCC